MNQLRLSHCIDHRDHNKDYHHSDREQVITDTHLDVILEVAPVPLAAAAPLLLGLDPGPGVSGLAVKLTLAAATSGACREKY